MGDGKLLAVVGALMGWKAPVVTLFLGATVAVIVIVPSMLIRGKAGGDEPAEDEPAPAPLPWSQRRGALWSLAAVSLVGAALVLLRVPPWIGAIVIIALALADDFLGLTDPADVPEDPDEPEADLTAGAVPFGPFLAVAALFWWFAEPYVMWKLRQP
jgi:hypothetical protein